MLCSHFKILETGIHVNSTYGNPGPLNYVPGNHEIKESGLACLQAVICIRSPYWTGGSGKIIQPRPIPRASNMASNTSTACKQDKSGLAGQHTLSLSFSVAIIETVCPKTLVFIVYHDSCCKNFSILPKTYRIYPCISRPPIFLMAKKAIS